MSARHAPVIVVVIVTIMAAAVSMLSCAGGSSSMSAPTTSVAPPSIPAAAPKAIESATIMIVADGFRLDSTSAAVFKIAELRVYKGGRLTFVKQDNVPHDIQSDPPHIHTECPEIGGAGFWFPDKPRSSIRWIGS